MREASRDDMRRSVTDAAYAVPSYAGFGRLPGSVLRAYVDASVSDALTAPDAVYSPEHARLVNEVHFEFKFTSAHDAVYRRPRRYARVQFPWRPGDTLVLIDAAGEARTVTLERYWHRLGGTPATGYARLQR
jgi:hypothetical protein